MSKSNLLLIISLTSCPIFRGLVQFQICIHRMTEGKGLPLFDKIIDRKTFKLLKTKIFGSGAIVLHYEPTRQLTTIR